MLLYINHYNFIRLILCRIRYTFSIVKIKSEKKREKIKQHCKITILYVVQCRQLDTHTRKNVLNTFKRKEQPLAYNCEFNHGVSFLINNASCILVSYSLRRFQISLNKPTSKLEF